MKMCFVLFLVIFCIILNGRSATLSWSSAVLTGRGGVQEYALSTSFSNPGASTGCGMWMDVYDIIDPPGLGTLGFVNGTLNIHQVYYLVNQDDLIDANLVNTGSPVFDNDVWSPTPYEMSIIPNQTFMLGYWVDMSSSGSDVGSTVDDYYCWAELQWTGSDLVLLNSAGVSGAEGIYAGTWDVIPEPTTIILFLLGGLAVFIKKKIVFLKD